MRECGLEPLQFNWFRATMRFYNSLTHCNSTTAKQVLHADMFKLSSRSDNRLSPLYYDSTQLSYPNTFKYLGMVRDKNINLTTAADAALRHFMAALSE